VHEAHEVSAGIPATDNPATAGVASAGPEPIDVTTAATDVLAAADNGGGRREGRPGDQAAAEARAASDDSPTAAGNAMPGNDATAHPALGDGAPDNPGDGNTVANTPPANEPAEAEPVGPSGRTVRIFLLDDHEVVRRGLRDLLSEEPDIEIIGEAGRADEALTQIIALRPDVAVLDARLQDGSGIEVCRQVRSENPDIACLILTSFDDEDALFTAIMAGASGYVLKQIRGAALVEAVRRVAAGQSLLDPQVTPRVLERLRQGPAQDERVAGLTDQERRILSLIAEGLTNRQIATRMYLAEKTVKNYVSSLLSKLGLESRTQAAVFATKLAH
jgi:two-component system response regulator DevR